MTHTYVNPHLLSMTKEPRIYNGEKRIYLINCVGKTEWLHAKESAGPLSHTIYKNKPKMDYRIKYKI